MKSNTRKIIRTFTVEVRPEQEAVKVLPLNARKFPESLVSIPNVGGCLIGYIDNSWGYTYHLTDGTVI